MIQQPNQRSSVLIGMFCIKLFDPLWTDSVIFAQELKKKLQFLSRGRFVHLRESIKKCRLGMSFPKKRECCSTFAKPADNP